MIAGIDVSSFAVDVVFLGGDPPIRWFRIGLGKGRDAFERSRSVRFLMEEALGLQVAFSMCEAIGIEEPRGFNPGPAFRVQGGVLQVIPRDALVQPWIPSQWRKAVGLKGNCTKDVIADHVHATLGETAQDWPQDACDAWCVAEATRIAYHKGKL